MFSKKSKILIGILILVCLGVILKTCYNKKPASVNKIVGISKNFKSVYKFKTIEVLGNTTKPGIKIIVAKITLPETLSEKEITNNLKAATVEIYNREKPYRILISAYTENTNIANEPAFAKSDFGQANFNAGTDTLNLKKYKFKSEIIKK